MNGSSIKILLYNALKQERIPGFKKLSGYLEVGDFKSADVKKIGDNLYRARLDRSNRLLFSLYHHDETRYLLVLEYLPQHSYEKSRFLRRGVTVNEEKIATLESADAASFEALPYINPQQPRFNILDKIISFDDAQDEIYHLSAPLIVIGSAGSGKTALTLEKMKETIGEVLYLTRSPYLTHHARDLYYAHHYENPDQNIDFLSFQEYLETIEVPQGREVTQLEFIRWFSRQKVPRSLNDPYQVFEEIKGVITGSASSSWLEQEAYLQLGVKQSIFSQEERKALYALFERYLKFLQTEGLYDTNIISYQWLEKVSPRYDFVVVDEVQDLTMVQLQLILKSLNQPHEFFLCGDSNQIVHPNFFSWSTLKSHLYRQQGGESPAELLQILHTNYRNTPEVTAIANRILQIKQSRFGSIDRESNYLVQSNSSKQGVVKLLAEEPELVQELDRKSGRSTRFAVIVMHESEKAAARQQFNTPLIFSIQEAKGLEYPNIILYNMISNEQQRFREITRGVSAEDLLGELEYRRVKDKQDKSLEIYKFHINALYVAITRAVENLYWIESAPEQPLFELLQVELNQSGLELEQQKSSNEEWQREAARLEQQGKQQQAEEIRQQILKQQAPPWQPYTPLRAHELMESLLLKRNKKKSIELFEYAMVNQHQVYKNTLFRDNCAAVQHEEKSFKQMVRKHYMLFDLKNPNGVIRQTERYGINYRDRFNLTPLMAAALVGNATLAEELIRQGADREQINNAGLNPQQIALYRALLSPAYRKQSLAAIYPLLELPSIDIQVDGRMIRLDNHLMEFTMFNLMVVLFYTGYAGKISYSSSQLAAFESGDFVRVLERFPDSVIPQRRKKRNYISSILSKNERNRDDRYNRKLFKRNMRGHYVLNPEMSIRIEGEWINIYRLIKRTHIAFAEIDIPPGQPDDLADELLNRVNQAFHTLELEGSWRGEPQSKKIRA